jgi:glyoxylase-like metal-dependent hydrolase (beta-lactamase superfamily II)
LSYSTLEDFFGDIVGKAIRGLGLNTAEMGGLVGLSAAEMSRISSYDLIPEDDTIHALAAALSLDGDKLVRVAKGWVPEGGNDRFVSDSLSVDRVVLSAGMEVNAYVLRCQQSGESALLDAGGEPAKIQELIQNVDAKITHILLTHGHGDHVGAVGEMKRSTGAPVYCSSADASMLGAGEVDTPVSDGWQTRVGSVTVTAHELPGHTVGGIGYLANDQAYFSGDALFAGSLGGARGEAYTRQIELVRHKVLGLSPDTKIFPGHGPITTVRQEAENNPCFS